MHSHWSDNHLKIHWAFYTTTLCEDFLYNVLHNIHCCWQTHTTKLQLLTKTIVVHTSVFSSVTTEYLQTTQSPYLSDLNSSWNETILLSNDTYITKSIVRLKEEMSTLRSPNKINCHLFIGRRILQLRKWKNFNGHICTMSSRPQPKSIN